MRRITGVLSTPRSRRQEGPDTDPRWRLVLHDKSPLRPGHPWGGRDAIGTFGPGADEFLLSAASCDVSCRYEGVGLNRGDHQSHYQPPGHNGGDVAAFWVGHLWGTPALREACFPPLVNGFSLGGFAGALPAHSGVALRLIGLRRRMNKEQGLIVFLGLLFFEVVIESNFL